MGSIIQRKNKHGLSHLAQIVVKKDNSVIVRENKTFSTREEAEAWIVEREALIKNGCSDQSSGLIPAQIAALPKIDANNTLSGVYFLFLQNVCIYVGQSENVPIRIAEHKRSKTFDCYRVLPMPKHELKSAEAYFIALMQPKENIMGLKPMASIKAAVEQLKKLGLKPREIEWHLKSIIKIQHGVQH